MSKGTKLFVWICNLIVVVLAVLSITSFFFAPFLVVNIEYTLTESDIKKMIGDKFDFELKEGIPVKASVKFETDVLLRSFDSDVDATVDRMIASNVDSLVEQITASLSGSTRKVVEAVAKGVVTTQVRNHVKDFLSKKNTETEYSDDEITQRLERAGVTDEYLESKTQEVLDFIYDGHANVDSVGDKVIETVNETYSKLAQSGDEDFADAALTEEEEASLRSSIKESLDMLADDNGNLDPDEFITQLLLELMRSLNGEEGGEKTASVPAAPLCVSRSITAFADEPTGNESSAQEEIKAEVRAYLAGLIPEETTSIIVWVLRGFCIVFLLSSLAWLYIVLKILIKFITRKNPLVKLKAAIWLGWLPFLLLVCVLSLALWIVGMTPLAAEGGMLAFLNMFSEISFSSIGWIAGVSAGLCFVLSIFYSILRRKERKNNQ